MELNIIQLLGFISEGTASIVGFFLMFMIIRKDRKYAGNVLMGCAIGTMAVYTGLILLYDIIAEPWAIKLFLPISMSIILGGPILLYFTFRVILESSNWLRNKWNWLPAVIIWFTYTIWILTGDYITIEEGTETVKTQVAMAPLAVMVLILLLFLIRTAYEINKFGLKDMAEGPTKERLKLFLAGIYTIIASIFVNIPVHFIDGLTWLMVVFFYMFLVAELIFAYAFLKKYKNVESNESSPSYIEPEN